MPTIPLTPAQRAVLNALTVDDDGNIVTDDIVVRVGTPAQLAAQTMPAGALGWDSNALWIGDGVLEGNLAFGPAHSAVAIAADGRTPAQAATNARAAYARAAAMTPNGSAIATGNHAGVGLQRGLVYDFSGSGNFDLSTAYVDFMAVGTGPDPVVITDSSNRWRLSTSRHLRGIRFKSSNNQAPIQFTSAAALTDAVHEDLTFDVAASETATTFLFGASTVSNFTARRCRTIGRRLYGGLNALTFDATCRFEQCEGGESSFGGGTSSSAPTCAATWLRCILRATSGQTNNLKFAGLMFECALTDSVLLLTSAARFLACAFDPASGAALNNGGNAVNILAVGCQSSGALLGTSVTNSAGGENRETIGAGFLAGI